MEISSRCAGINASITLAIDSKAKEMKKQGLDVVGLGAGEPDFDTPDYIKAAAKEALDNGFTKYTPASGTLDFKKAICHKLKAENGLDYGPENIVISNGAKHSLFNTFAAIVEPGREVIIPAPYWVTYPEVIRFFGGVPVFVETREENGFVPRPADIKKAVTEKTCAILINSPSNPCGAVMDKATLQAIAEIAKEADCYIVADEIYEKLVYDGREHISIASLSEDAKARTIVVNGLSKAYAMTGWRIGYTACDAKLAKAMASFQSHATSNPNSIAQYAGVAALLGKDTLLNVMVTEYDKRRRFFCKRINDIPGLRCTLPCGAFYIMMNIKGALGKRYEGELIENSMDFAKVLLEKKLVAIVPGEAFGAPGYCRISYATSMDNITEAMERIEEFVRALE